VRAQRPLRTFQEGTPFNRERRFESSEDELQHKVLTNINMTRELSAHRIIAHSNARKVVFVEKSGFSLGKSKIS